MILPLTQLVLMPLDRKGARNHWISALIIPLFVISIRAS
jgi:hypothetical protein